MPDFDGTLLHTANCRPTIRKRKNPEMTNFRRLSCSTALALALLPRVSSAEVTAGDVWQNQKDYLATLGGELVVSTARDGAGLSVSDASLTYQLPFGVGSLTLSLPGYSLLENGDGTVAITNAEPVSYGIAVDITDKVAFSGHVDFAMQGYSAVASGVPKDVVYTWSVDRMDIQLSDFELIPDDPANDQLADFTLSGRGDIADVSGVARVQVAEVVKANSTISMGRQEFLFSGEAENVRFNFVAGADNITTQSQVSLPRNGMDIMNLAAALRDGLAVEVSSTTNGYNTSRITEQDGTVTSDQTSRIRQSSDNFALDKSSLRLAATVLDLEIDEQPGKELPFPVKFNLDKAEIGATLPLAASSGLQGFSYLMSLEGLGMADELWDLFDPARTLPRGPANLTADLSGIVLNRLDWLDFLTVKATLDAGEVPVELHQVTLNDLVVEMAETKLTGSGAARFDNSARQGPGGVSRPTGAVDLVLRGGNGLLDNLVAMGLLSDEDAIGARMAAAVFTTPDPQTGEDVLKSRLEMTGEGHILANGQRLR